MEYLAGIVTALIGSGLIQYLINRHDQRKDNPVEAKLDKVLTEQKKLEKDTLRTQLLVMMYILPNNHEEILTLSKRYFDDLKGDWYMSSLFAKWLKENEIENPVWYKE